jgi:chemotaxis protein CheD
MSSGEDTRDPFVPRRFGAVEPGRSPDELVVGIGGMSVTTQKSSTLIARALGSCIGLALIDVGAGVAGLCHVHLPAAPTGSVAEGEPPARYADVAVEALLEAVCAQGGSKRAVEAVIAGGATMFAGAGTRPAHEQVGPRNERRVREELARLGIRLAGAATGGSEGRTIIVDVATGDVTVLSRASGARQRFAAVSAARPARRRA